MQRKLLSMQVLDNSCVRCGTSSGRGKLPQAASQGQGGGARQDPRCSRPCNAVLKSCHLCLCLSCRIKRSEEIECLSRFRFGTRKLSHGGDFSQFSKGTAEMQCHVHRDIEPVWPGFPVGIENFFSCCRREIMECLLKRPPGQDGRRATGAHRSPEVSESVCVRVQSVRVLPGLFAAMACSIWSFKLFGFVNFGSAQSWVEPS